MSPLAWYKFYEHNIVYNEILGRFMNDIEIKLHFALI